MIELIQNDSNTFKIMGFFVPLLFFIISFLPKFRKRYTQQLILGSFTYYMIYFCILMYSENFKGMPFSSKNSDWGDFGSYLGGVVGTILSFITIILVLWNMYKQNEENKKNNFDKMFILMLEQHNAYFQQNEFANYIDEIYLEINKKFLYSNSFTKSSPSSNTINSYLRFLYRFLKYLSDNKLKVNNINEYSGMLRSFISERLLYIIAINGIRDLDSFKSYRELLEEFHFLEHINILGEYDVSDDLNRYYPYIQLIVNYSNLKRLLETTADDCLTIQINNIKRRLISELRRRDYIYFVYNSSAFNKNPYYLTKIVPALELLVEYGILDKDLLKPKSQSKSFI